MATFREYLKEEENFSKAKFKKFLDSALSKNKGFKVFSSGGGMADNLVTSFNYNELKVASEKGKLDTVVNNVSNEVKHEIEPKLKRKGRKIMMDYK